MIEPVAFGFNAETAQNNYFQVNSENAETQTKSTARVSKFCRKLRSHGINVMTIKDNVRTSYSRFYFS